MKNKYYLIIALSFIVINFACNKESTCLQYATISATINFKTTTDSLKVIDTILPKPIIFFDTVYTTLASTNSMAFIMNSTTDSMRFFIAADSANAIIDTVKLGYTRKAHFISKDCGFNYFYTINSIQYSTLAIKKILISQPLVSDDITAKNLQIFY